MKESEQKRIDSKPHDNKRIDRTIVAYLTKGLLAIEVVQLCSPLLANGFAAASVRSKSEKNGFYDK